MASTRRSSSFRPRWSRAVAAVVVILGLVLSAASVGAAPPPGRGGGNGGGSGGGNGGGAVPEQHFMWRVSLPGSYSLVRPVVGNDGTIYAVDVADNLFAVAPDGSVRWSQPDAGSKGVDVGDDGTIYTGNENWIKAFRPDGTLKWTFVQNPRAFVFIDVAVGPDGHVYGVASSGMGVFSLEDRGTHAELRWQNPEPYARNFVGYTEIEFGPTADGLDQQLYFFANGHARAVRLSDGTSVFTTGGVNTIPRVSPVDATWHVAAAALSPNAEVVWEFDYPLATGTTEPALGPSGTHYAVNSGNVLYSIDPDGRENFHAELDEFVGLPDVDPTETLVILPAGGSGSTQPAALKAVRATNGSAAWRMEFPASETGLDQFVGSRAAFSDDGGTAYVMTATLGGGHAYLNAVATDPALPSASTILRSSDIDIQSKSRRKALNFTGTITVVDENLGAVSGATVDATWTLPDGRSVAQSSTTGGGGDARFDVSGAGGIYRLTVTDITLEGYTFDPDHSILTGTGIGF